jgi:Lrp/AsnC family transcriptional regulator for asnA, asnC and gidA
MEDTHHIDELDRKILTLITKNARIPYLEVARECKVSGAAIHQRIQRLTKMGVITGSEFSISPKKLVLTPVPMWGSFWTVPAFTPKWWNN